MSDEKKQCELCGDYILPTPKPLQCVITDFNLANAAPDLLAALKRVVAVADRKTVEFDAARAAIAKAEGRESQGVHINRRGCKGPMSDNAAKAIDEAVQKIPASPVAPPSPKCSRCGHTAREHRRITPNHVDACGVPNCGCPFFKEGNFA